MLIIIIILAYCIICFSFGIVQYIKNPKPPNGLTLNEYKQYYYHKEWQIENPNELTDIHKQEQITLLDETIIKYNKLLDNLTEQYTNTYNSKEKSRILAKQIITLEKLNKALDKRKKLDE